MFDYLSEPSPESLFFFYYDSGVGFFCAVTSNNAILKSNNEPKTIGRTFDFKCVIIYLREIRFFGSVGLGIGYDLRFIITIALDTDDRHAAIYVDRGIYIPGLCSDRYRISHFVLHGCMNIPTAAGSEQGGDEEEEEEVFHVSTVV